jgi:hypothetical protein
MNVWLRSTKPCGDGSTTSVWPVYTRNLKHWNIGFVTDYAIAFGMTGKSPKRKGGA